MMKSLGLLFSLVWMSAWGAECRFFRVGCVEGRVPENLSITSDLSGDIFLKFDAVKQYTYVIRVTDRLVPTPAWRTVFTITGHSGRVSHCLTTRRWTTTLGGSADDEAWFVEQTSDGGYIVVGTTQSFGAGGSDVYLIKTDQNGLELWSKTFGGSDYDEAHSVQQTSDGGYIVAGRTRSFGADVEGDMYLIKTDGDGNDV
jgi:hypothetical protein